MKKILSILMSLVMLVSVFSVAVNAVTPKQVTPVIIVSGLGSREYHKNIGAENESTVFPPSPDLGYIIPTALINTAMFMLTQNMDFLSNMTAGILDSVFEDMKCDENGNPKHGEVDTFRYPLTVDNYEFDFYNDVPEIAMAGTIADEIGSENVWYFNYDWRIDPWEIADQLKAYIDNAKAATGSDKVVLVPCSMGGVQTMTYVAKYGYESIEKVVFMSAAHKGLHFVSELFKGNAYLSQKEIFTFLSRFIHIGDEEVDSVFDFLFGYMSDTIFLKPVFGFLNKFGNTLANDEVYDALRRTIAGWPGMWAFVCADDYDEARAFMTTEATTDAFKAKIDNYHNRVGKNVDGMLSEMQKNGVAIAICSHYNRGIMPFSAASNEEGDYLIETVSTSNGATVAHANEKLPTDYVQAVNDSHNHLSADRKIDASTCLFPDYTWFIKDMDHVGCPYESEYAELLKWLVTFDGQPTVYDNAKYPQFMQTDYTQMKLEPLSGEETDAYVIFKNAVVSAYSYIKGIFVK